MATNVITAPSGRIVHNTYAVLAGTAMPQRVHVTQYDESLPVIACTLYKDGQLYDIPAGANVRLRMNKNGLPVYHDAMGIDDARHVVYLEITAHMTVLYGEFAMIIEVETADAKTAGTSYLRLVVRQNPVQDPSLDNIPDYTTNAAKLTAEGVEMLREESKTQQAEIEKKGQETLATIPEEYTQLNNDVVQLKEDIRNENLFVKQSAVIGARVNGEGGISNDDGYFASDYIPIERFLSYKKNSPLINVYHRMCVYDTNEKFIKKIDDTNEFYNEDGAYVRFCGLLTEIDAAEFIQSNAYDAISRLEIKKNSESCASFKEEVYNNTGYYKKSNDYTETLAHGWSANGTLLDSDYFNAVELNVKPGEKIAFAGSFSINAKCLEVLYDGASKNMIEISGDFDESNLFYHKVPNGVTKILLSVKNEKHNTYKHKFQYFKDTVFEATKRVLSQAQFIGQKFYSTAHQGYIGYGSKENTAQAFIDACESGKFNCIETDARLTKDNIFVLSHNESIEIDGITYVIKEKTYAELKKVAPDICSLEECMKICKKYGVYLLIDKLIYSTVEENTQYLFPLIRKYRMQDTVLFSSAVSREEWSRKILEFNPRAKIAFYYPNDWFTAEQLAKAKSYVDGKNEIIITCNNTAITEENLQLFYDNCDGVKIGTSVQSNLELYKSLFYTMDYIDSNKYGVIDCFYN